MHQPTKGALDHPSLQMNQDLGAQAFTHGSHVYYGAGKAPAKDELTGHELTHVVQQTGNSSAPKCSPVQKQVIQAKLQGSAKVLETVDGAGKKLTIIKEKLVAYEGYEHLSEKLIGGRDKINSKVQEIGARIGQMEQELKQNLPDPKARVKKNDKLSQAHKLYQDYQAWLDQLNAGNRVVGERFQEMFSRLTDIESKINTWLNRKSKKRSLETQKQQPDDPIVKQRQALEMLLQRVKAEKADIQARKLSEGIGFDQENVASVEYDKVGGALNKLDLVKTSDGFEGFFKAEKAIDPEYYLHDKKTGKIQVDPETGQKELGNPGARSGIPELNPNFGGRSVAMYRLDQLLNANIIVKTEFATKIIDPGSAAPKQEFGILMEKAQGSGVSQSIKEEGLVRNVDEGALQQSLSKLQLLDALAGQVDRHQGNYYIERDASGKVVGVKGIDNDLAFGTGITPEALTNVREQKDRYRGIPPVADKDLALRIIHVDPEDVRKVLTGLLSDDEVAATLARLKTLKEELLKLQDKELLKGEGEWGSATLTDMSEGGMREAGYYAQLKSYAGTAYQEMCQSALDKKANALGNTANNHLREAWIQRQYLQAGDKLKQDVQDGILGGQHVQEAIDIAIDLMANDTGYKMVEAIDTAETRIRLLHRVR